MNAQVRDVLDAETTPDRRPHGHDGGRPGIDQAAGIHQIVVGIGQDDESFLHEDSGGFKKAGIVGKQGFLIADHFQLHPVRQPDLAAQASGANGFIGRITGGGVGQKEEFLPIDMIEQGLLGAVGQVHSSHGDRHHFSPGGLVAARHFLKTTVFPCADE